MPDEYKGPSYTVPYAGETATMYAKLSDLGLAPRIVCVNDTMITTVGHRTLPDWLADSPSDVEKHAMATRVRDLLLRVHAEAQICHRDVHVDNIVVDGDQPLLIGPKWAAPSVNHLCYDLVGPDASGVDVPDLHKKQGHNGVWWDRRQTLAPCSLHSDHHLRSRACRAVVGHPCVSSGRMHTPCTP